MKIRLAILSILLGCAVAGATQPHHFYARFTSRDGLPETYLSTVCQDSFGRIWVGSRDGVFYYTGDDFVQFNNPDYIAACSASTSALLTDAEGCIWVVSSRGTGFYNIFSDHFTVLEEFDGVSVRDIDLTPDGFVWLTTDSGIWKYAKQQGKLTKVMENSSFSPFRASVTNSGNLVVTASNNSIYLLNTATGNVRAVSTDRPDASFRYVEYAGDRKALASNGLHEICLVDMETGKTETLIDSKVILNKAEVQCLLFNEGLYWIGTSYGLLIYDPVTKTLERQFPDEHNSATLGAESVRCLFTDDYGDVWAGTWNGGLRCWLSYEAGFSRFVPQDTPHSLVGNTVRAVCDGPDGSIWIGTEEGHLNRFNPSDQSFDDFTDQAGIAFGTAITDIARIDNLLWITSYGDGITTFDPVRCRAVRKYSLPTNECMTILKASDGNIYVGTMQGLYRYNQASGSFELVEIVGRTFVHSLVEDRRQRLIIGSYLQGFGIYDMPTASFRKEQAAQDDAITSLTLDSRGIVWATTDGSGVARMEFSADGNSAQVRHYDKQSGMPSNFTSSITEGKDGHLWIATVTGLVEFDPVNEKIIDIYMQADDVVGGHFTFGSNFKTPDGMVFLGTNEGLLMFDPVYFKERFGHNKIHITDIALESAGGNAIVSQKDRSAITSESIRIKHKDAAYISLTFSSMDYASPNNETYECTLTGNGFRNSVVTDENHIAYSGLRPGSYRFTVDFENSEDFSTGAHLDINIVAPWYRTKLAYMLYLLLLGGLVFGYLKQRSLKKEKEAQRRLELTEAMREKDLAHEKMNFFTNIAHEIRTPVSVLQILLDKASSGNGLKEDMKAMRLNVDRLKKLCDDLLDFRKMDSGQTHLVFAPEDVCAIVRKSINSFESAARARNLDISAEFQKDAIMCTCDADAIESIICNLLSNSIKYSDTKIECKVAEQDGNLVIRVQNDGIRVPDEESELIFEAFYQSKNLEKNGTGLGLTYSRKIATLHNGRLFLDTGVKDLNSFVLEIPLNNVPAAHTDTEETSSANLIEEDITDLPGQKAVVLVVEDNEMMRNLIRDSLIKDYDILTAGDGEEALSIVRSSRVDLVVSDIMMPKMDGCELCNAIKEDISLSHIPVLLLTAAVGVETHIRSLKSGADAYIEKPFKMDVLRANISNLFRNRDIRNEQFSSSPLSHYSFSNVSKVELDFMNSLHSFILDHISETNLSLDRLAEAMAVSRATLTRKVKADTGMTVNEYVRICRLKKAVELLAENNYRINEVAYLVGFSSPSYFTLSFQKQFGKLPSEFTKKK